MFLVSDPFGVLRLDFDYLLKRLDANELLPSADCIVEGLLGIFGHLGGKSLKTSVDFADRDCRLVLRGHQSKPDAVPFQSPFGEAPTRSAPLFGKQPTSPGAGTPGLLGRELRLALLCR